MADDAGWSAGRGADSAARRGRVAWSEAVAEAVLARLARGESLSAICRDAGMPSRVAVRQWAWRRPDFGEQMLQAMREARLRRRRADLARAMVPRDPRGRWSTYTAQAGAEICRRLVGGESLIAICRDEHMPCYATVLNWARAVPAFGEAYGEARRLAADYLFDEAREIALKTTPGTVWADRLRFDILRWQAARTAPRKYQERLVVVAALDERAQERRAARAEEQRGRFAGYDFGLGGAGEEEDEDGEIEEGEIEGEAVEVGVAEAAEGEVPLVDRYPRPTAEDKARWT